MATRKKLSKIAKKTSKESKEMVDGYKPDLSKKPVRERIRQALQDAQLKVNTEASADWRRYVPPAKTNPMTVDSVPDDNSQAWELLNRMRHLGLVVTINSNQLAIVKTWKDVKQVSDFLKNSPAGSTVEEHIQGLKENFGIVSDPPKGRFQSFARSEEFFIDRREAQELDKCLPRIKHNVPNEPVKKSSPSARPSSHVISRLEQLMNGGIKAESDKEWYDNFKPQSADLTTQDMANVYEKLEAAYADKIKLYLKAKREMEHAKHALELEYNKDYSNSSIAHVSLPNESANKAQPVEETKSVYHLSDALDQLFEGKTF